MGKNTFIDNLDNKKIVFNFVPRIIEEKPLPIHWYLDFSNLIYCIKILDDNRFIVTLPYIICTVSL